ncbi:MAG: dockerin type I domain-containing protein [Microgenomates group bacterium]
MVFLKSHLNKKLIFLLVIFILALSFFANLYLSKIGRRSRATEGEKVKVIFNASSFSGGPNTQFSPVKIQGQPLGSNNNPISITIRGYRFNLNFDKNLLEVVSMTYPSSCPEAVGISSTVQEANNSGLIKVACASLTASGYVMSSSFSDLLTVVFKARSESGNANLSIDTNVTNSGFSKIKQDGSLVVVPFADSSNFSLSVTIGGSSGNSPTPTPNVTTPPGQQPTNTPIPTNTPASEDNVTLNLKLKFQGITKKPTTNKMNVRVKLGGSQSTDYQTSEFTVDENGVWSGTVSFNTSPGSEFTVYVKGPKHIQKKVCHVTPTESWAGTYRCANGQINLQAGVNTLDFSGILMLAGDLPEQDGVVNSYDTSLVRNNLGKKDEEALRLADINLDGVVDTQDYSLIIAALSVRTDEE